MTAIVEMLAPWWQQIAGVAIAVLGFVGVYFKGRSDQKAKAKLEDVSNANEIRKAGADARAHAAAGSLRDSDGWKRD